MIFRYAIVYVEDVAATMVFYEKAFGLGRGMLHAQGDYGEMRTGETKLSFSSKALMRELGKASGTSDPARPVYELAFETDDVESAFAKAVAAGAKPVSEPARMPWGQTISYVSDPDGTLVEICSPVANPG